MLLKALACDFDGTLASEDRIGPEALDALVRAREAGLRLILVTGRTFFELTRVCDRLDLFEAAVAENGAVLYFPGAAMIRDQGPPPPKRLLAELDRRGILYQAGRVIVGVARVDEPRVREALVAVGVTRDLVYNRAALMLLPSGVSKGTGVRRVLGFLGLSFHDVLGLGDAENDLEFFEACGWSGCPADAVEAIRTRADWVFPGADGQAVAAAITGPILQGLLAVEHSPRHRIAIGWVRETSEPVTIPARGVNVLVHGDPLSGKSWLAGALIERLVAGRYAICVIDPEGDYRVLRRFAGVAWTAVRDEASMEQTLATFEHDPAACVVADLSLLPHAGKLRVIETALGKIQELRRRLGRPHWVLLDEAHYSLHREGVAPEVVALTDKGFCLVTYHSSWLRKEVVEAMDLFILARTALAEELDFLRSSLVETGLAAGSAIATLSQLPPGEFLFLASDGPRPRTALTFVAPPRETAHVRHLAKYADSRVGPGEEFIFRHPDGRAAGSADSLHAFRRVLASVEDPVISHHAGRGDFSRWVLNVFRDPELGRQLSKTEARWRRGEIADIRQAIDRLIGFRYGAEP
ncbi:MAG TPA: HAD hydrolase family protein [Methylomirabilota bacterium]|nr:HAD hydrolase family protein [Methylomirabilota bacterium]